MQLTKTIKILIAGFVLITLSTCTTPRKKINTPTINLSAIKAAVSDLKTVEITVPKVSVTKNKIVSNKPILKSKKNISKAIPKIALIKKEYFLGDDIESVESLDSLELEIGQLVESKESHIRGKVLSSNDTLINQNELITLEAFEYDSVVPSIAWASELENLNLTQILLEINTNTLIADTSAVSSVGRAPSVEEFKNDEVNLLDVVTTVQAKQIDKKLGKKINKDDLVFLDFEKEGEDKTSSAVEPFANSHLVSMANPAIQKLVRENFKPKAKVDIQKEIQNALSKQAIKNASTTRIVVNNTKMNKGIENQIFDIEFTPLYDSDERAFDNEDGEIILEKNLNGKDGIVRGKISKESFLTTHLEVVLSKEETIYSVPMFERSEFIKILETLEINGIGGHYLIEVDDRTDEVDIDSEYESRVLLDNNFKVVKNSENYSYVLFLGVVPGNALVKYLMFDGSFSEKLTYIVEDEILFNAPIFNKKTNIEFSLKEMNILGNGSELSIETEQVGYFNQNIPFQKLGPNRYSYKAPYIQKGFSRYLEITHLEESIYIGHKNNRELEIPSQDFVESLLSALNVESLSGRCLVQINLNRPIEDILVSGDGGETGLNFQLHYLNSQGEVLEEPVGKITKAFLVAESTGIFGYQINYQDKNNSKDVGVSFCSESAYLVEQL